MKKNLHLLLILSIIFLGYSCKKSETTNNVITYNNFKINSVTLNAFPSTDNTGATWDYLVGTDPDIYFNIDSAGTTLYDGSNAYQNNLTQSNLPFSWPALPTPQIIRSFSSNYSISLFDADNPSLGDSNDSMGQISFVMNDHKTGYPTSFQISSGAYSVTINGTWY